MNNNIYHHGSQVQACPPPVFPAGATGYSQHQYQQQQHYQQQHYHHQQQHHQQLYHQQQQLGALRAQRESFTAHGNAVRSEQAALATDRATLEHQAKLLKMQEKQKKKEGKKLIKKEKELGVVETRALRKEAKRKFAAGEPLTPQERLALNSNIPEESAREEKTREKKEKKISDKRVKELRKEMREVDLEIERALMGKQQIYQALSMATGEPIPAMFVVGAPGAVPMGHGAPGAF